MRDFNIKINEKILEDNRANLREQFSDEEMANTMRIADSIVELLAKEKTDMYTAYTILTALAYAIYVMSAFGENEF